MHITVTVFDERLDGESLVSLQDQLKQALRDAGWSSYSRSLVTFCKSLFSLTFYAIICL